MISIQNIKEKYKKKKKKKKKENENCQKINWETSNHILRTSKKFRENVLKIV